MSRLKRLHLSDDVDNVDNVDDVDNVDNVYNVGNDGNVHDVYDNVDNVDDVDDDMIPNIKAPSLGNSVIRTKLIALTSSDALNTADNSIALLQLIFLLKT